MKAQNKELTIGKMETIKINPKKEFLSDFIPQEFPRNPQLLKVKEEAENALRQLDFPTTRDEQWKYTRISKILKKKYTQIPAKKLPEDLDFWKLPGAHRFVFINGFFSSELSKIGEQEEALILPLSKARKEHIASFEKYFGRIASHQKEIFTALNTVYHTNGAFILLGENVILKEPVHIVNIGASENAAFNPRNLFILGKNSSANVITSYESISGGSFANAVSEIFLEEKSKLTFHLLQNENETSFQVNTTAVHQKSGSNSEFFTVTSGGSLVRNNLNISLDGENCVSHLHGLYMGKKEQHFDNHTLVEHKKPNSFSNELYKGIMNGKSAGVFNGKVLVYKDAQKTNAYQSNQNILLSDDASIDSKPELEIYADDVKCSHGSTTGQLDDDAIFYLRSRGISEKNAKQLLILAFAGEVVEKIGFDPVKNFVTGLIEKAVSR